jgi:hypothetical protein
MKLTTTTLNTNEFQNIDLFEIIENFEKFHKVKVGFLLGGSTVYLFAVLTKEDLSHWHIDGIVQVRVRLMPHCIKGKPILYINDAFGHF